MTKREDNLIEITYEVRDLAGRDLLCDVPMEDLKELILLIADEFEAAHMDTDWLEKSYPDEIVTFTDREVAQYLWGTLTDVPMNPETEKLEAHWNCFPAGTSKWVIWHWFEEHFPVKVAVDLMGQ